MLVCFVLFRTRGCGCIGHPAFPAPSEFFGRMVFAKTRAQSRGEIAEPCFAVIARSEATLTVIASEAKQSTARAAVTMDCFVASAPRNDARKRGEIAKPCLRTAQPLDARQYRNTPRQLDGMA